MTRYLLTIFFSLLFYANTLLATEIKQVEVYLQDKQYELSADIDYQLTARAKEALNNGVPLFWNVHIKLWQQRDYWWNKRLLDFKIRYRLQYHALLNMYRVLISQGDIEQTYNFSTLSAALDLMANIKHIELLTAEQLFNDAQYFVELKAEFDTDALPLPLRPIAYTNPQWYLSSPWTLCPLKK